MGYIYDAMNRVSSRGAPPQLGYFVQHTGRRRRKLESRAWITHAAGSQLDVDDVDAQSLHGPTVGPGRSRTGVAITEHDESIVPCLAGMPMGRTCQSGAVSSNVPVGRTV